MKLVQAIVNGYGKNVVTKYGERSVVDVLVNGQKEAVWGAFDNHDIIGRHPGEKITLGQDSKGKLHIIEHAGSGLQDPTNSYPTAPLPQKPQIPSHPEVNTTTNDLDLNKLVERHANLMSKCYREIKGAMGELDEEIIQKYAVSLYIQVSRQLESF